MQEDHAFIEQAMEKRQALILDTAQKIWEFAELPYEEYQSAELLCSILGENGFTVEKGVANIPTAFTGTYVSGNGKPVMGFLGEYDALDVLSQKAATPLRAPVADGAPGHGCGHNNLGAGALGAALLVKDYLVENNLPGTVIYFGCAAEEGAGAKQFMARDGLFDAVDFCYTWHPATKNEVDANFSNAIMGANFQFFGTSSHAGGTPWLGRSALDAAELMSVGVNYLREHMIDGARIHYAYVDAGGTAANVVQDHTLIKYEVRSPKVHQMKELFERVVNVARGAALMTDTRMEYEVIMAYSDYIPNDALAHIAYDAMVEIGPPRWDAADYALAKQFLFTYNDTTLNAIKEGIRQTYGADRLADILDKPLDSEIHPYDLTKATYAGGSTDVGDVTYACPCLNLRVATACIGNGGHTWQCTAQNNSSISQKGLIAATKMMALSAIRTMGRPDVIAQAKQLVLEQNGGKYQCPLPDDAMPPIGRY
ncbi:amidohydrolase [Eubacteriales bacterium OttesenSCG-928-M02]|nr:amidohydrolase [Eubacteriales bacterium OttesenSCG-928-M02]